MNRGYDDFDKEKYSSFLSKMIMELPKYDTCAIVSDIYSHFSSSNQVTSQEYLDSFEDIYDEEDVPEDTTANDTMLLMAQMGFPTEFSSSKAKKHNNNNSRNKKLHDLDIIFECIRDHIMSLLSDDNELIKQWIINQRKDAFKLTNSSKKMFCTNILSSDSINADIKQIVKLLNEECKESEIDESTSDNDLVSSFQDTIDGYIDTKCVDWIKDLNLSDNYKSAVTLEDTDFIEYLLNSIGLSYKTVKSTEPYKVYPIIPAKSVVYSLKHDFSLDVGDFDDIDEDNDVDCHTEEDPMDKYYFQRYRFFDKFDEGILLDEESWYSVTPAIIAQHNAMRFRTLLTNNQRPVVIDAFCGAGGNAIRLAEQGFTVLAIDIDEQKLKILLHNAAIYNVASSIVPICHDFFDVGNWISGEHCPASISSLFSLSVGVNISPPWGGPEYLARDVFDIGAMDFVTVMAVAEQLSSNIACFIPRQSNVSQIVAWLVARPSPVRYGRIEIEQNCVLNKVKALTLYTNHLARSSDLLFM